MNSDSDALFLSRSEFDAIKHDPLQILARATDIISRLQMQESAMEMENKTLQDQLRGASAKNGFDSQRHREVSDAVAELERDHRMLCVRHGDAEMVNRRLAAVVDRLRQEEAALGAELQELRSSEMALAAKHAKTVEAMDEIEKSIPKDVARARALQEAIDKKIESVDAFAKERILCSRQATDLHKRVETLGCERLALEAETTALDQTTKQQERTINYLQHETAQLEVSVKSKTDELVELKKQMSAALVELQLQMTRAEEEMTRLHNAVANERNLTGKQNIWQAKELQAKTEDLLALREGMARDHGKIKSDRTIAREKSQRQRNNMIVVEQQHKVLGVALRQLEEEDKLIKEAYNNRKESSFEETTKQEAVLQQLNVELQKAREDAYIMRSKMCKDCTTTIIEGVEKGSHRSLQKG